MSAGGHSEDSGRPHLTTASVAYAAAPGSSVGLVTPCRSHQCLPCDYFGSLSLGIKADQ